MSAIENNITNQLHPYHPFKDSIKANGHDWNNISKLAWSNVLCDDVLPNLKNSYSGFELFNNISKINAKSYFNLLSQKEQIEYLLGNSDDETLNIIKSVSGLDNSDYNLNEYIVNIMENPENENYEKLNNLLDKIKLDFIGSDYVGVKISSEKKYKPKKTNMELKFQIFEKNKSNYPDNFFNDYISVFWNICKTNNNNKFLTNIYKSFILNKNSKKFVDDLILTNNLNLIYIDTLGFPASINNKNPVFSEELKQRFLELVLGKNINNKTNNNLIGKQLEELRTYVKDNQFKQIQKNQIISTEKKQKKYYAYHILEFVIKNRDIEIYLNKTVDQIIDIYKNTKKVYTNKGTYYLYNCSNDDIKTIEKLLEFINKNKKTSNLVFETNFSLENVDQDLIIYKTEKKDSEGEVYYEYYYNEDDIILPDLSIDYIYKHNIGHFKELLVLPDNELAKYVRDKRLNNLIYSLLNRRIDFILKVVVKYLLLHNNDKPMTELCKKNIVKIINNKIIEMKITNKYNELRNKIKYLYNLDELKKLELPNTNGNIKSYIKKYVNALNLTIPEKIIEQLEWTTDDLPSPKSTKSYNSEVNEVDKSISEDLSSKPILIVKTRRIINGNKTFETVYETNEYTDDTIIMDIKNKLEKINNKWEKDKIILYNDIDFKNDTKIKNIITQDNNIIYLKKKSLFEIINPLEESKKNLVISNKSHEEEPIEELRGRKEDGNDLLAPTTNINFIFMYKIFPTVFHCLIYNWYMFFELENTYLLILKTNVANIIKQLDDPDTIKQELIIQINSLNKPELKKLKDTLIVIANESSSDNIDKEKFLIHILNNPSSFKTSETLYTEFLEQENLWINKKLKDSLKKIYYKQIKNNVNLSQYVLTKNINTLQFLDVTDPYIALNSVSALNDIKTEIKGGLNISSKGVKYLKNQMTTMRKLYRLIAKYLKISNEDFLNNKIYYRIVEHIYKLRVRKCNKKVKKIILSTNIYNQLSADVNKFLQKKIQDRNYNLLNEKLWEYVSICAQTFKNKKNKSKNNVCMENISSYQEEIISEDVKQISKENLNIFLTTLEKDIEKDLQKIAKTKKIIPDFDIVNNLDKQEIEQKLFEEEYKNYFLKYFS